MWEILLQRCALTNRSSSNVRQFTCVCKLRSKRPQRVLPRNIQRWLRCDRSAAEIAYLVHMSPVLAVVVQTTPQNGHDLLERHSGGRWETHRERARRVRLGKTRPEMPDRYTTRRSGDLRVIRSVGDFAHERARRTPWVVGGRLSHLDLNIRVVAHHVLAADREWTSKKHKHITSVLRRGSQRF